jgi:hypothetical protein
MKTVPTPFVFTPSPTILAAISASKMFSPVTKMFDTSAFRMFSEQHMRFQTFAKQFEDMARIAAERKRRDEAMLASIRSMATLRARSQAIPECTREHVDEARFEEREPDANFGFRLNRWESGDGRA